MEALMSVSMTHPLPHPATTNDPTPAEALRRVTDEQIGPRGTGAIYHNQDGIFEVQAVIRDPQQASELLKRRCAQWALIVKNILRPGAEPVAIGTVWTTSDHLVREATAGGRSC
jgi:hypothetical protein